MRLLLVFLGVWFILPRSAAESMTVGSFVLHDQNATERQYHFPKNKISVLVIADRGGSDQLEPWIARLYSRYGDRIDIDGIADVSIIPPAFHGMFRAAFRRKLVYPVMLDWTGSVVNRFKYQKGEANLFVVDRRGNIMARVSGSVTDEGVERLFRAVDRASDRRP